MFDNHSTKIICLNTIYFLTLSMIIFSFPKFLRIIYYEMLHLYFQLNDGCYSYINNSFKNVVHT